MGISGDKIGHLNFHLHLPHIHFHGGGRREGEGYPEGERGDHGGARAEQQRFVIPVMYVNHPLFMDLLKEAEEEYGFKHDGPINIPCHVEEFRQIRGMIDKEAAPPQHHHHHNHNHNHGRHDHHQFLCFRA